MHIHEFVTEVQGRFSRRLEFDVLGKQYGQILKRLPEFAATGATIIACLNSPFLNTDFLPGQMARWCPRASLIETLPAAEDFPERYPDRGLKIYRFEFS